MKPFGMIPFFIPHVGVLMYVHFVISPVLQANLVLVT